MRRRRRGAADSGDVWEIQWAEIDRERKRWIVGGRGFVRDSAGYKASRHNIDSSSGCWQMFKASQKRTDATLTKRFTSIKS